jgi:hypothetical protein
VTQFRLAFDTHHDADTLSEYLKFYSGNYATAKSRPTLIIKYNLP